MRLAACGDTKIPADVGLSRPYSDGRTALSPWKRDSPRHEFDTSGTQWVEKLGRR